MEWVSRGNDKTMERVYRYQRSIILNILGTVSTIGFRHLGVNSDLYISGPVEDGTSMSTGLVTSRGWCWCCHSCRPHKTVAQRTREAPQ